MRRQNHHKLSLLAAAVLSATFGASHAALVTVDNDADAGIGCTLREAIVSVNNGSFTGGCSSSNVDPLGTNDTIVFDASLNNATIMLQVSELLVEEPVAIDASTLSSLTISAAVESRVMSVNLETGENVWLSNLTLSGGAPTLSNGGGILLLGAGGGLILNESTVSGNTARFGGGLYSASNNTLTIVNSVFANNRGTEGGAGMAIASGTTMSIQGSVISNNTATFDGGGITSTALSLDIDSTTISGNSSTRSGAGISLRNSLVLTNSTLHSNSTAGYGGAISSIGSASSPQIINSTISGNMSNTGAGSIHTKNATSFYLQNSTLKDNASFIMPDPNPLNAKVNAASLDLANSILTEADGVVDCVNYYDLVASSASIIQGDACGTMARTALTGILPLSDNGGLTMTHALEKDSNAVDTGDLLDCTPTDQRGETRDEICDVGAYEFVDKSNYFVIPIQGGKVVVIPSEG